MEVEEKEKGDVKDRRRSKKTRGRSGRVGVKEKGGSRERGRAPARFT